MNADLTLDDLRAYRDGRLSDAERLRIEALLRSEPLYADALDGLDALLKTGHSPAKSTEALRAALHDRIKQSASKKRLWHLWMAALIACILLMLCVAIYLIFYRPAATSPAPAFPRKQVRFTQSNTERDTLPIFVHGLSLGDEQRFRAYVQRSASATFGGPLSVRIALRADGTVRAVDIENGVLMQEPNQKRATRQYKPSDALRIEAEQLVRQYPHWPHERLRLLWITGWRLDKSRLRGSEL